MKYQESAVRAKIELLNLLDTAVTKEAESICSTGNRTIVTTDDMSKAFLIVLVRKGSEIITQVFK